MSRPTTAKDVIEGLKAGTFGAVSADPPPPAPVSTSSTDVVDAVAYAAVMAGADLDVVPFMEPLDYEEVMPKKTYEGVEVEPDFYLQPEWFDRLVYFIERGDAVLLIGPAGAGKSTAVEKAFAGRGQPLEIVSVHPRLTASDFEGATELVVEDRQQITKFTLAAPAIAVRDGHGLLLDEADAGSPEAMFALYRAIDGKDMRIIRKTDDSVVPRNPAFRCVATQNTQGRGDDRGLYHGRGEQDEAFLDRWDQYIQVTYPKKEEEVLILRKRTGISGPQAEKLVDAARALRAAQRQDEVMLTMTVRRTLAVASNLAAGMSPALAWRYAVLNRATPEDQDNMKELLRHRIYGHQWIGGE